MMGSGFMKDMINSARSNRILLKKGDGHAYTPFDTASYPITKKSNKKASYRKASPAHLQSIKTTLSKANKQTFLLKVLMCIVSILIALMLVVLGWFFFLKG